MPLESYSPQYESRILFHHPIEPRMEVSDKSTDTMNEIFLVGNTFSFEIYFSVTVFPTLSTLLSKGKLTKKRRLEVRGNRRWRWKRQPALARFLLRPGIIEPQHPLLLRHVLWLEKARVKSRILPRLRMLLVTSTLGITRSLLIALW